MGAANRQTPVQEEQRRVIGAGNAPHPPHLFVPRPRLDRFLDRVPTTPASLVVAPAGSGKTAAAAAWAARAGEAGHLITWLRPERPTDIAAHLAADRARTAAEPSSILVIEDAHLLGAESAALLTAVLTEDADAVRLLLLSRRELDFLPVSASLAGQVQGLAVGKMRFTDAEACELVRAHHPGITDDEVSAVLSRSDGWAAALVLGAHALRAGGEGGDPWATLAAAREPLLDYLAREVVDTLSPELVQVLVTTSQEPQVTADEAALLSGIANAKDLLTRAASSGLLVTVHRDEADGLVRWRQHPLLLDLLRRRTAPTGPDWARVVEAHHRATEEYVDRRDGERAVHHARLTGDLDLQLRVLREFAAELLSRQHTAVLAEVLSTIPVDIRSRHQELLVLQATLLRAQNRVDAAKAAADRALAADARSLGSGVHRDIEAELAVLELWQARFGWREAEPALERARRVLGCRHDGEVSAHDIAEISPLRATWLTLELATFESWLGDIERAAIHIQDAAMYVNRVDLPLLDRSVLSHRATLEMLTEAYQSALASAVASLAIGCEVGATSDIAAARAHLVCGWSNLQALRLADAEAALAAFDATPREQLDPLLLVYGRLLRACMLVATGEVEAALRLLDGRGDVPQLLPRHLQRVDGLVRLLIGLAMGDLPGLEAVVHAFRTAGLTSEASLAEAVVVGLGGDEQRAVSMLDGLLRDSVDVALTVALGAAVARVAFLDRIGTVAGTAAAQALVPNLLSRAAPQRMVWMLTIGAMISPGFVDLIDAHASADDCHPFAGEAAIALRSHPRPYPDLTPHRPTGPNGGPGPHDARSLLTPRELEVLGQLALGGGNADLARSLFVSENTVKTHLASIYRKLEVDRRIDALRVARARGLL